MSERTTRIVTTAPPYMWLHIGDYLRDTSALSAEAHGCYLRLLMALWTGDGVISCRPDVLARAAGVTPRKWARLSKALLPFFASDGVVLTQKRLVIELRRAQSAWLASQSGGNASGQSRGSRSRQGALPFESLSGASPRRPVQGRTGPSEITPELRALLTRR